MKLASINIFNSTDELSCNSEAAWNDATSISTMNTFGENLDFHICNETTYEIQNEWNKSIIFRINYL